jgi:hypothetical protein
VFLAGCGGVAPASHGRRTQYAQTVDSATSACLRNPACYTAVGDDAVLPWLARTASAVRTVSAVLRMLSEVELKRVENILEECAKEVHFQVNEREFGPGKSPTREQCEEVVRVQGNQKITRAMELGTIKHELALECARKKLEQEVPGNYSLEPRYAYDLKTNRTRLLTREQVEEWLKAGWLHLLLGTLVPDVVLHETGNPMKVQAVYDLKFPCHPAAPPSWNSHPAGHPYFKFNQKQIYQKALGTPKVNSVSPNHGVSP